MKLHFSLAVIALVASHSISQGQSVVNSTTYPGLFGPSGSNVTVVPELQGLATVQIGGDESGALGTYWTANAHGGAAVGLSVLSIVNTGAQVKLTGSALQFNMSNNPGSVLGALASGLSLNMAWDATATLNSATAPLNLRPNSTYRLNFDVDTGSGLLKSTLGITPTFTVSMLDSNNQVVGSSTGATLVNIIGLQLGTVAGAPSSGRATVEFKTGANVGTGAAKLKFAGSAILPVSLTNVGTSFANVSNLSLQLVDPYVTWIENSGVTDPAQQDPNADPDGDGRPNIVEYALSTDPAVSDGDNLHAGLGDPDGSGPETSTLIMTLPVLDGTSFNQPTGTGPQVGSTSSVTYQVEGSFDLVNWNLAVSEVTPNTAFTSGLPTLPAGYSYRSFRVPGQTADSPRAFLRVKFF